MATITMNYNHKLSELLQNVKSWSEIKSKLEEFNTSQTETSTKKTTAGKLFEYFAKYYFTVNPEYSQLYSKVWLYDEIPTEIKTKLNFPDRDFGIDLLLQDNLYRFTAVQCKFKNDEDSTLTWKRDSIAHPFALADKCEAVMIFTNAAGCVSEIEKREKFNQIAIGQLIDTSTEVLQAIKLFIDTNAIKHFEKFPRLPHQIIAVNKTIEYFNKPNPRAQLILPCGAGKTLAALWIKEDLQSKNTLVLFPSLALLRQFKTEWANQREQEYIYINVCSEKDIDVAAEDSTVAHTYEISGEVTTSPKRISEFLTSATNKIVFCTYQSIEAVETALKFLPDFSFDLIICDEAHRTAGAKANTFAIVHDKNRIRGKKRLYMTATPKIVSNKLKARLGDDYELLCDMSNTEIFGDEAHHMSFGEAIQLNILVDYKIIGIGVTHKQVKEFIEKRRYVTDKYDLKEIADNYALDIVMDKYSAFHAITFHSRVKTADEFAQRHNSFFASDVYARHVSGEHTTSRRAKVLTEFKLHKKGVVSNARCLTEGVDVPIIDLIYFCDPKNSKIDIVQASGRALRKDRHGIKPIGYIVVPIYHHIDEDIEKEIERKPYFQNLIQVIRSLCDQDERLRAEIDDVAFEKGEKKSKRIEITYNDSELENVIKLEGLDKRIREFLFEQIIEKTRNYWNVKYLQLKAFIEKFGHSTISKGDEEHRDLYYWIGNLRKSYHEGSLTKEKTKKLNDIGFDWKGEQRLTYLPPDEKWKKNYKKLEKYFAENRNTDIPARYTKDKPLATWVVTQRVRYNQQKLTKEQIDLLEEIDFNWDPKTSFVPKFLIELKEYKEKYNHVNVPTQSKEHPRLGRWVNKARILFNHGVHDKQGNVYLKGRGELLKNEIDELNLLGFVWDASNDDWDGSFNKLKEFFVKHGHSKIKQSEYPNLYNWCYKQRNSRNKLTDEEKKKLATVNFDYFVDKDVKNKTKKILKPKLIIGSHDKKWNEMFESLKAFKLQHGHFFIPKITSEDKSLSSWSITQRISRKKGMLSQERINKLNIIEFPWMLPKGRKKLSSELKTKKDKVSKRAPRIVYIKPNAEEKAELKWLKMFDKLFSFVIKNGHTNVKRDTKENERLALWLVQQRKFFRENKLPQDKIEKFKRINVDLSYSRKELDNAAWMKQYNKLVEYYNRFDNSNVPSKWKEDRGLAQWVLQQRVDNKKNLLSKERIELLNKLNFSWSREGYREGSQPKDDIWIYWYEELKKFKGQFGNCNVPQKDKTFKKLGRWLNEQRNYYTGKKNMRGERKYLRNDRQKLLEELGVIWDTREVNYENLFNVRFKELIDFFKIYGHFNVPQKCKEFPKLGTWLSQIKHRGTTTERIKRLEEIGFVWNR
ncbi:MAG: Helicase associated domain protein [Bacteroidia bacterium]